MVSLISKLDDFDEVVLLDTEFVELDGDQPAPVALVAYTLRAGTHYRLFFDDPSRSYRNPLPSGPNVLYVAFSAQAEWKTFRVLGWPPPDHVLDLFAEFRAVTNGRTMWDGTPMRASLIAALNHYGLDAMAVIEKQSMIDLIKRGHPFTQGEQSAILDYCSQDVVALEKLVSAMLPDIDIPYAVFRGRYSKAVGAMEFTGTPIDVPMLNRLCQNWSALKLKLAGDVEAQHEYGVYDGISWSSRRFAALLDCMGILDQWPRTPWGYLSLDDDTFEDMAILYPHLAPLRELRSTLVRLNKLELPVGHDGRNRAPIMPYRSCTGRNYPPTSKFIFGKPTWLRSLVKPEPGRAVAYVDLSSAEFGIAAALSEDRAMKAAYESGDVYMAFAVAAGAAPRGATKDSNPDVRDLYKTVLLAVQYRQSALGLAKKLGKQTWQAQELLDIHRRLYDRYWQWSEWITQKAIFSGTIETVFGWPLRITPRTNPRTIANFPMQANGAEILRWACCYAIEAGIEVHAPVQDALLVGGPSDDIDDIVRATQAALERASSLVLGGFPLRSDSKVVRFPERYADERGVGMWNRVMKLLEELESEHRRAALETSEVDLVRFRGVIR